MSEPIKRTPVHYPAPPMPGANGAGSAIPTAEEVAQLEAEVRATIPGADWTPEPDADDAETRATQATAELSALLTRLRRDYAVLTTENPGALQEMLQRAIVLIARRPRLEQDHWALLLTKETHSTIKTVRALVAQQVTADRQQARGPATVTQHPAESIRAIMNDEDIKKFDKPRLVTALIAEHLGTEGRWVKQQGDERLLYFATREKRLYDLDSSFINLLAHVTTLSPGEDLFKVVLKKLVADLTHTTAPTPVRALAHYDPTTGLLAVSDGGTGIWVHAEPGAPWEHVDNGTDGLFFAVDRTAEPWVPEWGADETVVRETFERGFLFTEHDGLTRADQLLLLRVWLANMCFPALRRSKPIPAFLGPQGSTKSWAIRRIGTMLVGPDFEVAKVDDQKEDGCRAAITHRTVFGLDNADKEFTWLENFLATYATGTRYDLREYYTTNTLVSYLPRALLLLSSRDPRFNRPDVAQRVLPFWSAVPEAYLDERTVLDQLVALRPRWWGTWLTQLGRVADGLATVTVPPLRFRMADYAAFGWAWTQLVGGGSGPDWGQVLQKLEGAQAKFAAVGDGVIAVLRALYATAVATKGQLGPIDTTSLFHLAQTEAELRGYGLPKTANGFGQALTNQKWTIEVELKAHLIEHRGHAGRREIELRPRVRRQPVQNPET